MWNAEFLKTLNEGERSLVNWQYAMMGGFEECLWGAIKRADTHNLNRISMGFPEHVEAYINYTRVDGWWTKMYENLFLPDETETLTGGPNVENHG